MNAAWKRPTIPRVTLGLVVVIAVSLTCCRPAGRVVTVGTVTTSDEGAAEPPPAVALAEAGAPQARPAQVELRRDASDEFFEQGRIPQLRIQLSDSQAQRLREDARRYVQATLLENGDTTYAQVALKLKGAAGSFRELDDRPAFTLNMDRHRKNQRFHDLEKFHLNNSVQDESYLCELLCARLCQAAGLPTPRVTHARVWLNERDLGLYVLKEGFDKRFLQRHFRDASGNLYDGGFLRDVDAELEKDGGDGPDDFSDLHALVEACRESDPETRWRRVAEKLDVDPFLTFMAIERLTCHWDGYTCNRNNYRLYFDPASGRAHFFPHGMDQMFGDPGFPVFEHSEPIVAAAVLQNPEWRAAYRARVDQLLPLFAPAKLHATVDAAVERLKPVLVELGPDARAQQAERVRELKERLSARAGQIAEQRNRREPEPLLFGEQGLVELADWYPAKESDDAQVEAEERDGRVELVIRAGAGERCVASWRRKVLLAQGEYRLEARVRTRSVDPLVDEQGTGAGVRISGGRRENKVVDSADWRTVSYDFQVSEPSRQVELVAELRARTGEARFVSPLVLKRRSLP